MKIPNYIIENKKWILRRENRKKFIKNIEKIKYKKQNKTAIICLFYSSWDNIKKLSKYIYQENFHDNFDLIIINNSSYKNPNFEKELENNNIIILSPIANLWTDGWYAFGLEYCIENNYEYVFLVEDDVTFLDLWIFSEIYKNMNKNTLWFLTPLINFNKLHSRYVQIACYPIDFIKKCGVIDPRFFTRGWDGEWSQRIEKTIKKYWYTKSIINKKHYHPYLKKNNRNPWRIYFSWRNIFRNIKKTDIFQTEIIFFMYIRTWFSKLLLEKYWIYLNSLYYAIRDFLLNKRNLSISLKRMNILSKSQQSVIKNTQELIINLNNISEYTKDLFVLSWLWIRWFTDYDLKKIQWKNRLSNFRKKWMIIPNINCPLYPIAILTKKIITINEFDIIKDTANISIIKVDFKRKYLKIIISFLLTIIVYIFILIPINIKFFVLWIKSLLNKIKS